MVAPGGPMTGCTVEVTPAEPAEATPEPAPAAKARAKAPAKPKAKAT